MTARKPDVDQLARRLPRRAPSPERTAALRRALLEAAEAPPPRRWTGSTRSWVIGGSVAAAAAVLVVIALHAIAPPPSAVTGPITVATSPPAPRIPDHARVVPARPREPAAAPAIAIALASNARLPEGISAITATRQVYMTRGDTTITAPPGARFEVDVRDDQVHLVTVTSGWVVVASARSAATVVIERQSWILEPPPPPPAPAPPPPATPAPAIASAPPPPPSSPPATPPPATPPPAATPAPVRPSITASRPVPRRTAAPPPVARPAETRPAAPAPLPAPSSAGPARVVATPSAAAAGAAEPGTGASAEADAAARAVAAEREFSDGLHALLAGASRAAIGPLDRACGVAAGSQEDACYWAAVAWLRIGERVRARRALADVLARWPRSTHAGEASVALGWLQLEAGDRAGARTWFAAAANDPMPSVRADAARGLAAAQ